MPFVKFKIKGPGDERPYVVATSDPRHIGILQRRMAAHRKSVKGGVTEVDCNAVDLLSELDPGIPSDNNNEVL